MCYHGACGAETGSPQAAIERGRRRFRQRPQPWIDLSTGITPVAYPVAQLHTEIWSRPASARRSTRLLASAPADTGIPECRDDRRRAGTRR